MQGTIVNSLNGRKLSVLVILLIIGQIICFLIGDLFAPNRATSQVVLGTACQDDRLNETEPDYSKWYYPRGEGACQSGHEDSHKAFQVVYAFQMPIPRGGFILEYSKWQKKLIGLLQIDMKCSNELQFASQKPIVLDARLAYKNKGDSNDAWKPYASTKVIQYFEFTAQDDAKYHSNCGEIPLMALGSLYHDYYLLNIRLLFDTDKKINQNLSIAGDIWLTVINQNGRFTKVLVYLKTTFFPIVLCVIFWYWRRVNMLSRTPTLLEYIVLALGSGLSFLNMPLEYLTLFYDMPFLSLLSDIKQGIFYAIFLSFCLIFSGEHLMVEDGEKTKSLITYWRHLSAVFVGCLALFVFDMYERVLQLTNPFFSCWATSIGKKFAEIFVLFSTSLAGLYLTFLTYMIYKVFINISVKRQTFHNESIIYRFKFLMVVTLLCALLTVIEFILEQAFKGPWKWNEEIELKITSGFFTGVYGMWNIYIISLLCLYAPSQERPIESSTSQEKHI